MKNYNFIFSIILSGMVLNGYSQEYSQEFKALAEVRQSQAYFGSSVDISDNFAIVGAPFETNSSGAAYIFERNSNGTWELAATLFPNDPDDSDLFGRSVSISGHYAVAGAENEDEDEGGSTTRDNAGSAYIFKRDAAGSWTQSQKIVASDRSSNDHFGFSVSICGEYLIIGATGEDHDEYGYNAVSNAGSAYIFERNQSGVYIENSKIVAPDRAENAAFGNSTDISGDYAIAGAWYDETDEDGNNNKQSAGSAYIFKRNNVTRIWSFNQKIVAPDREEGDNFGYSVSINNNQVLVGAPYEDHDKSGYNTLSSAGSAYFFRRALNGLWYMELKAVASDRSEGSLFGNSVCVQGNKAIIGAENESPGTLSFSGKVYIFSNNGSWEESQKLTPINHSSSDKFGSCVAIDQDYAFIGAEGEKEDAQETNPINAAGAAYIFENCTADPANNPENIVENGDFGTCSLSPWNFFNAYDQDAIGTYQLVNGSCIIKPASLNSSPEGWHIQLEQLLSASQIDMLDEDEQYILSFDSWAEVDNMPCHVFFGQNESPNTALLDTNILLNTLTEQKSFEFTASPVFSLMKLAFDAGTESTWAAFDNVSLVKKAPSSVTGALAPKDIRIILNASTDLLDIYAQKGSIVTLYTITGVKVLQTTMNDHVVSLNVANLNNGIYILRINKENFISTKKIIIQ